MARYLCNLCGAKIRFVTSAKNPERTMILDGEPHVDGNVEIVREDGQSRAVVHSQGQGQLPWERPVLLYMPHQATCEPYQRLRARKG
jgi:hypothetical protein